MTTETEKEHVQLKGPGELNRSMARNTNKFYTSNEVLKIVGPGAYELRNAEIMYTNLGFVEGQLTAFLTVNYGSSTQKLGGQPFRDTGLTEFTSCFGLEFIYGILLALDCPQWEMLTGTRCRVVAETNKIHAIGHFIKEEFFMPGELVARDYRDGAAVLYQIQCNSDAMRRFIALQLDRTKNKKMKTPQRSKIKNSLIREVDDKLRAISLEAEYVLNK